MTKDINLKAKSFMKFIEASTGNKLSDSDKKICEELLKKINKEDDQNNKDK